LTASGKVARGELQSLLTEDESEDDAEISPLGGFQLQVAEIWAQELGQQVKRIKRQSHFMELGGHSISALRVCRRLVQLTGAGNGSEDDVLGGDLGELSGTFSPQELLQRPKFQHYVQFLQDALGHTSDATDPLEGGNEGEDAVQLLHRAAAAGSVVLIDFLIGGGFAPVDGHCSNKRLKAATRAQRSLQQTGKDVLRPSAPLHSAVTSPEAIKALLRHRAQVTATEGHGVMALHLASAQDQGSQVIELLLDAKAPLAAKDLNQQTVLHFAARAGSVTLASLLTRWLADDGALQGARVYGGPLDWRDRWHRTPLHWAVLNGHFSSAKVLLEARANADPAKVRAYRHERSTTLRHESPLEIAQRMKCSDMVAWESVSSWCGKQTFQSMVLVVSDVLWSCQILMMKLRCPRNLTVSGATAINDCHRCSYAANTYEDQDI